MTVFTIKAKNKKQAAKIKAALKLIDVAFSTSENDDSYDENFVKKVLDADKGTFTRVKKENLKSFIESL
jgi:hypothetical protein